MEQVLGDTFTTSLMAYVAPSEILDRKNMENQGQSLYKNVLQRSQIPFLTTVRLDAKITILSNLIQSYLIESYQFLSNLIKSYQRFHKTFP